MKHVEIVSANQSEALTVAYRTGQAAFERGEYRKAVVALEQASALVDLQSRLGGEIQTWLVTAYEAAGQRSEALDLCRSLQRHPDLNTRKQGKRLLYILEAPKLKTNPEWLTQIPDLSRLADSDMGDRKGVAMAPGKTTPRPEQKSGFQLEPISQGQTSARDNRFIWVALVATILLLGSLIWLA